MNCCKHDNEGQQHENKHKNHMWMILCCGLPVLILILLPLISGRLPGVSFVLGSIVPFLCPVMMIGMMFFMHRDGKNESACRESAEIKQLKE